MTDKPIIREVWINVYSTTNDNIVNQNNNPPGIKLPVHNAGLFITHNEHKNYYESLNTYIVTENYINFSQEEYEKCLENDEIWEIHWYPDTPMSSCAVFASTLEKALELANQ